MSNKVLQVLAIMIAAASVVQPVMAEPQWMADLRNGNGTESRVYGWLKRAEKLEQDGEFEKAEEIREHAFEVLQKVGTARKVYEASHRK